MNNVVEKEGSHRRSRPVRVLCADDNELLGDVMLCLLAQQGYWVEHAEDGQKAWSRACASRFDVLVTDHEMPRCNGLELVSKIQRAQIPAKIVVHSSALSDEQTMRYRELGVMDFVAKGSRPESLLAAVQMVAG